jgi:NAD(P)H-hydrate repair Nnr-like enzyme with NAD(P)H-hydrate dehydratase domain
MSELAELLAQHPLPDLSGSKDERGTIMVIGGPATCPGAAVLAGLGALRVGAGRVQLVVDPEVAPPVGVTLPEALVLGWDRRGTAPPAVLERLADVEVALVGSGCQQVDPEAVAHIAAHTSATMILDAGALGAAATLGHPALVMAPNLPEAAELAEDESADVSQLACMLADRLGAPVAVRGRESAVSDGMDTWWFGDAPPGMGTPGSGDVCMGVLAGMLSTGLAPIGALGWAVRLHADAGHHLASHTPAGYLARDVARALPSVLSRHLQGRGSS